MTASATWEALPLSIFENNLFTHDSGETIKKFLLQGEELASESEKQASKKKRGIFFKSHPTNIKGL